MERRTLKKFYEIKSHFLIELLDKLLAAKNQEFFVTGFVGTSFLFLNTPNSIDKVFVTLNFPAKELKYYIDL